MARNTALKVVVHVGSETAAMKTILTTSMLGAALLVSLASAPAQTSAGPASGPLRTHPTNPRYFTDGTKNADGTLRAVFLTGSHTWQNLQDLGPSNPPPVFDYDAYLDLVEKHGHNFMRLWRYELVKWVGWRGTGGGDWFASHQLRLLPGKSGQGVSDLPSRWRRSDGGCVRGERHAGCRVVRSRTAEKRAGEKVDGGAKRMLQAPFTGDAVLYLNTQ